MIMDAIDVVKGSLAECWLVVGKDRYNFAQAISLEASVEKTKSSVPVLGKTGKHNIASGWQGSGTMTLHYNSPVIRDMLYEYKSTGVDTYFEIEVLNEAPNSNVGNQMVILKGCTVDGGVLTKFDADADYLDEDVEFTFDDFEIPQKFVTPAKFVTKG